MIEVQAKLPGRSVFLAGEVITCEVTFTHHVKKSSTSSPLKCECAIMIEVQAKLPGRSVFLAGEVITCQVTFTHHVKKIPSSTSSPLKWSCGLKYLPIPGGHGKGPRPAKLAWASAQIHCQCTVSESRVNLPKAPLLTTADVTTTGNETAFVPSKGEKGLTVLSTKPTILFCDLTLDPGESRTFIYRDTIPPEAPASFRGTAIKYSYKVTIGAQRFHNPTRLLRVPFRVLVVPGVNDLSVYTDQESLKPSNPFHRSVQPENTCLEVALEVLQTMTCRKGPNYYNITNARGKVARFCLFKQAYRIGDDIVGTCDFSESTIPCVQFSVTLQSEEQISEECRRKAGQAVTVTTYSKQQEFCLHSKKTHICLPVPLTSTPGFNTDIVCLKWRLHFEFVTTKAPLTSLSDCPQEVGTLLMGWKAPAELEVETMVWDLPIKVFATNPLSASSVSLLKIQNSCFV